MITITVDIENDAGERVDLFCNAICPALSRLETLVIELNEDYFDRDEQRIIISICIQLRGLHRLHLEIEHGLSVAFLRAFASRHQDIVFPNLTFLRFVWLHGDGLKVGHLLRIRDALTLREQKGVPKLQELVLETSEPRQAWSDAEREEEIDLLRTKVGQLQFVDMGA